MQNEAGDSDFDYAKFSDEEAESARTDLVKEKGFFIFPSQLFCNVKARAKDDPNLNVTLAEIFKSIEASAIGTDSEDDLKGLFADIDVNSNKIGNTVEGGIAPLRFPGQEHLSGGFAGIWRRDFKVEFRWVRASPGGGDAVPAGWERVLPGLWLGRELGRSAGTADHSRRDLAEGARPRAPGGGVCPGVPPDPSACPGGRDLP